MRARVRIAQHQRELRFDIAAMERERAREARGVGIAERFREKRAFRFIVRQLLRLLREYPREPLLAAVAEADRYGLYDLDRLERMILQRVARDYFLLRGMEPDCDD